MKCCWALQAQMCIRDREIGGEAEWVPLGTFWAIDWDTQDDALEAQVRARDRLELLRKSTFEPGAVEQNVSLYDLAEAVLRDAGLKEDEYAIDEDLQNTIIPLSLIHI